MSGENAKKLNFQNCDETGRRFKEGTYPLICSCCGKTFKDRNDYWLNTTPLIKGNYSDGLEYTVFEYRNCGYCDSTLICELADERDMSPQGVKRRAIFTEQLKFLVSNGIEEERAIEILRPKFRS